MNSIAQHILKIYMQTHPGAKPLIIPIGKATCKHIVERNYFPEKYLDEHFQRFELEEETC